MKLLEKSSIVAALAVGALLAPEEVRSESTTRVLPLVSFTAKKGSFDPSAHGEGLGALAALDNFGDDDKWDRYIETTPDGNRFQVEFDYKYVTLANDGAVTQIKVGANTIGEAKSDQRRLFQIYDFSASKWTYLGDNKDASSWVWHEQSFVRDGTLSQYFSDSAGGGNGDNLVRIRFKSNNKYDVSNLDFLEVEITVEEDDSSPSGSGTPTDAPSSNPTASPVTDVPTDPPTTGPSSSPTAGPTNSPTARPSRVPTKFPTSAPSLRPTSSPTTSPTSSPSAAPMTGVPTTTIHTPLPTTSPVSDPTSSPTSRPTEGPTGAPTSGPTRMPTLSPSRTPTTKAPTAAPSGSPTSSPVIAPPVVSATVKMNIDSAEAAVGSISDQGVDVLKIKDMSGTSTQQWSNYLEATPNSNVFEIVFEFKYDLSSYPGSDILQIAVRANTIGQMKNEQLRQFQLYDFASTNMVTIGDNEGAADWTWFPQAMFVADDPSRFVSIVDGTDATVRIVFHSNNNVDASDIDYLDVELTLGAATSIPTAAPNTPSPTSTPTRGPEAAPTVPTTSTPTSTPSEPPTAAPTTSSPSSAPTESPTADPATTVAADWWKPKASDRLTWQWQIGEAIPADLDGVLDVDVYNIDLFDNSNDAIKALQDRDIKVICYFSAGTYEGWRPDWEEKFDFIISDTYSGNEKPFAGNMAEWDERWLDIREIDLLAPVMRGRLQMAKEKGCDAVEPDNIDAYTNGGETEVPLTADDQFQYNKWLADEAHAIGMSIGLKNDVDQRAELEPYFDWALNEQCNQYNECGDYETTFVANDKAVFGVEYSGSPSNFCPKLNGMGLSWLKKNLDLKAYRVGCEDYANWN